MANTNKRVCALPVLVFLLFLSFDGTFAGISLSQAVPAANAPLMNFAQAAQQAGIPPNQQQFLRTLLQQVSSDPYPGNAVRKLVDVPARDAEQEDSRKGIVQSFRDFFTARFAQSQGATAHEACDKEDKDGCATNWQLQYIFMGMLVGITFMKVDLDGMWKQMAASLQYLIRGCRHMTYSDMKAMLDIPGMKYLFAKTTTHHRITAYDDMVKLFVKAPEIAKANLQSQYDAVMKEINEKHPDRSKARPAIDAAIGSLKVAMGGLMDGPTPTSAEFAAKATGTDKEKADVRKAWAQLLAVLDSTDAVLSDFLFQVRHSEECWTSFTESWALLPHRSRMQTFAVALGYLLDDLLPPFLFFISSLAVGLESWGTERSITNIMVVVNGILMCILFMGVVAGYVANPEFHEGVEVMVLPFENDEESERKRIAYVAILITASHFMWCVSLWWLYWRAFSNMGPSKAYNTASAAIATAFFVLACLLHYYLAVVKPTRGRHLDPQSANVGSKLFGFFLAMGGMVMIILGAWVAPDHKFEWKLSFSMCITGVFLYCIGLMITNRLFLVTGEDDNTGGHHGGGHGH